jgi:hypothetical protein
MAILDPPFHPQLPLVVMFSLQAAMPQAHDISPGNFLSC